MKKSKKLMRLQRSKRSRMTQRRLDALRLVVHKTGKHIYAQIIKAGDPIASTCDSVLVAVSTLEKTVKEVITSTGNISAAAAVGKLIAIKANNAGILAVAFDRSGFKYHGRVKALADAARENGLII